MIKEFTRCIILVSDNVKDIENDEYVHFIGDDIVNDDSVDLNKEGNHTPENNIEKDDFFMPSIQRKG